MLVCEAEILLKHQGNNFLCSVDGSASILKSSVAFNDEKIMQTLKNNFI